jgi:hypothetical protein
MILDLLKAKETPMRKARYIRVYDWQLWLPLSKCEILAYAFVYGYNRLGKGFIYDAIKFSRVLNVEPTAIDEIMQKLERDGFVYRDAKFLYWVDNDKIIEGYKI